MFLKNTFNVFSSNFTLTYRLLACKFIVATLCCAIGFSTVLPLFEPVVLSMQDAGIFESLAIITQSFKDLTFFSDTITSEVLLVIGTVKEILIFHSSSLLRVYLGFGILLLIWYLASSAIDLAICEVINFFCKQKTKRSLVACFISRFVDVCKYTFFKMFLILPVELCIITLTCMIYIFNWGGFFSTSLAIMVFYTLWPLKNMATCCFAPALINSGFGVFKSFKQGLALSSSKWVKVYSSNLFIMIIGAMFCFLASVISLGALAIYAFAIYSVYFRCYTLVVYYNTKGMRFYCDSETVITPYIVKVQEGDYIVDLL